MAPQGPVEWGRVILAPLEPEHLERLQRWDADPEVTRYTGRKFAGGDPRRWLEELRASPHRIGFAILVRGYGLVGDLELVDLDFQERTGELRICIGEKAWWGRGIGPEAVEAACRYAFQRLGLRSVYLRVPLCHWRAIRCYLKCGFRAEGILRAGKRRRQGMVDLLLMVRYRRKGASAGPGRAGANGLAG